MRCEQKICRKIFNFCLQIWPSPYSTSCKSFYLFFSSLFSFPIFSFLISYLRLQYSVILDLVFYKHGGVVVLYLKASRHKWLLDCMGKCEQAGTSKEESVYSCMWVCVRVVIVGQHVLKPLHLSEELNILCFFFNFFLFFSISIKIIL